MTKTPDNIDHTNINQNDPSESGFISHCLEVGYDIVGFINNQINKTIDSAVKVFSFLNICGCTQGCKKIHESIEQMGQCLDRVGESIDGCIDGCNRTPGDDLRDIARLLSRSDETLGTVQMEYLTPTIVPENFKTREMDGTAVKVKLSRDHTVEQVMVRYSTDKKYINVPFEPSHNPVYIQNIFDTYFDAHFDEEIMDITSKQVLFEDLESYYHNSRKNKRSANWFANRAEWVKFSCIDKQMKPCGFKRFKTGESSENFESEN